MLLIFFRSDHIGVEGTVSAVVEESLHLAGSGGPGERTARKGVIGAESTTKYNWIRAMGNSMTPPRKSEKFW